MTALLLICATLLAQGQPAQLPVRMFDVRSRHELSETEAVQPLLRARLRMLGNVDLRSLIRIASQSLPVVQVLPQPIPGRAAIAAQYPPGCSRLLALCTHAPRAP